jgi:hypothetical protein
MVFRVLGFPATAGAQRHAHDSNAVLREAVGCSAPQIEAFLCATDTLGFRLKQEPSEMDLDVELASET